jgi:hypothetical protein
MVACAGAVFCWRLVVPDSLWSIRASPKALILERVGGALILERVGDSERASSLVVVPFRASAAPPSQSGGVQSRCGPAVPAGRELPCQVFPTRPLALALLGWGVLPD